MNTFLKFLYELLSQFFLGFKNIFTGLFTGLVAIFNVNKYISIIQDYKQDLSVGEWILVVIIMLIIVAILALIIFLFIILIKKIFKFKKTLVEQESLIEEIGDLNNKVATMMKEKEEILAMKVSQIGLKPNESATETPNTEESENETGDDANIRFSKLNEIDIEFKNYKIQNYNNSFTLPELVELFRNFAASQLKLYYSQEMIRLFISALASTKIVILQGISGTGKTSLAYAWGKFLKHDSCIASVQPSWRDRSEVFGYFNEFTRKFNETDILKEIYKAGYTDDVYTIILDEMNISRVEYYFAEMLSILEMPNHDEWIIEIVSSAWKNDPIHLKGGKLHIADNVWYIGTINNDDSTFMITDKVYDRAMPINIDTKGVAFDAPQTEAIDITSKYFLSLFDKARKEHPVSDATMDKIAKMDDYVIEHFRLAFGNRIVKQLKDFVPAYIACGGEEIVAVDYLIANKILRKFDQLNLAYIRNEIDGFEAYLDELFGENKMVECKAFLERLKKTI